MASSENIFCNHSLLLKHSLPIINHNQHQAWPSLLLICCFVIIVFLKVNALPKMIKIVQATYSNQAQAQLEREEFDLFRTHSLLLQILYFVSIAFLLFKINVITRLVYSNINPIFQFGLILFFVIFFYGLNHFFSKIIQTISDQSKSISEFELSSFVVNQATGMFLFPWLVLAELSRFDTRIFMSGAAVVVMCSIVLKWYRGFKISFIKRRIGLLQILTYFCALEILPCLVLVKYLIENF